MKKLFRNNTKVSLSGIAPGAEKLIELDADGLALDVQTRQAIKNSWLVEVGKKAETKPKKDTKTEGDINVVSH